MQTVKRIALVAHDNCKKDMVEWVDWNSGTLLNHHLICTGTTGRLVSDALKKNSAEKHRHRFKMLSLKSGPFGGDQQLGAMIAEGGIDFLISSHLLKEEYNPAPPRDYSEYLNRKVTL